MNWIEYKNNEGEVIQAEYPLVQTDKLNYMRISRLDSGYWELTINWLGIHNKNLDVKDLAQAKIDAHFSLLDRWIGIKEAMSKMFADIK